MNNKTKHLAKLFLFLLSFSLYSFASAQENLPAIIKKISPSVVSVITYDEKGELSGQGSGFFINQQGAVITNRHVLEGSGRAEIKTASGKSYPLEAILAEDKEVDLIRFSVKIPAQEAIPLSISKSVPEVGEKVIVIGNPLGLEKTVSDGIVSAVRDIPGFGKILQITAPISPGSSGSPVVNMKGEVLGVATFQSVEGQNLNFALPGERIEKLKPSKARTVAEWNAKAQEGVMPEAEGLLEKGKSYLWAGDYEKAITYFEKAVRENPLSTDTNLYFFLGFTYAMLQRYQEAMEAYKEAIRLKPNYAEAHYNLGLAYGNLGRYQEAVEAYKQSIRVKPDDAVAYINMGTAYGGLGRNQEAMEAYKQAIRLKPNYAEAHYGLGLAYGNLGRYQEAVKACKEAIRLKPDLADAHYNLGVAYLFLGDKALALEEYKLLKDLDKGKAIELFNLIYK